jgi:type III pantothenate kinase
MQLIIDQGNTTTKYGLFEGSAFIESRRLSDSEWLDFLENEISSKPWEIFYSSVRSNAIPSALIDLQATFMSRELLIPIGIDYTTPESLGTDRIANAVGAAQLNPDRNSLIVDCGSCTTYSLILEKRFAGGSIAPGLRMRLRAMHEFTGKLPSIQQLSSKIELMGKSTIESLESGAFHGSVAEIDGMIEKYCSQFGVLDVIMNGGDGGYLAAGLKNPIFAEPNLTLIGLNEIYLYNKSEKSS